MVAPPYSKQAMERSARSRPVSPSQRYSYRRGNLCPICHGGQDLPRGRGVRCHGYASDDGRYAFCTREEHAGSLPVRADGTYCHRLDGPCRCLKTHGIPASMSSLTSNVPPARRKGDALKPVPYRALRRTLSDLRGYYRLAEKYRYYTATHDLAYEIWRYVGSQGKKTFRPVTPLGGDNWVMEMKTERIMYQLPELLAAPADAPVLIVEGEKCADAVKSALNAAGLKWVVTTTPGGAVQVRKVGVQTLTPLAGRLVVILPDHDDAGERYAAVIANYATAAGAAQVIMLRLEGLSEKCDVADWLAAGHDGAELAQLVEQALQQEQQANDDADSKTAHSQLWPMVQSAYELMNKELPPVRWAVTDTVPEGITLLAAKPKKGKSTLMLHVAAAVAAGGTVMGRFATSGSDVLYLALEDNERRMQRRLRRMLQGQEVSKGFHIAYNWLPLDQGGLEALTAYLDHHPTTGLLVVDTLEHLRPSRHGSGGYSDDYASVRELQQLAGIRQLAVIAIHHLRKAPATDPFDEINATMGLMASVDNALVMRPTNNDLMELFRRGRDFEDDTPLALSGDRQTLLWKVEGQLEVVKRSAERTAVINILPGETAPRGMKPREIAAAMGKPAGSSAIRKLLHCMSQETNPPVFSDDQGEYRKRGNAGNAGNANM